jgi:hypothetical protein
MQIKAGYLVKTATPNGIRYSVTEKALSEYQWDKSPTEVNSDTRGVLFELIITSMKAGEEIQKCTAEDCDKYFMPVGPNAWRMKYCSTRCREREAKRRYRKKKKKFVRH